MKSIQQFLLKGNNRCLASDILARYYLLSHLRSQLLPMSLKHKIRQYQYMAVVSLIFALVGFSYNAWRLQVSEANETVRTASFEVLIVLADLEQIIYGLHYDNSDDNGTPRTGWVKVGLAKDLSIIVSPTVYQATDELHQRWQHNWQDIGEKQQAVDNIIEAIDKVREQIRHNLSMLQ